jgi:hypothetical protein
MNHRYLLGAMVFVSMATLLSSCVTTNYQAGADWYRAAEVDENITSTAESEDVLATIVIHNRKAVEMQLVNKTAQPLIVDWDSFAYMSPTGESERIIHSGVRLIDRDKPQARNTIPGHGKLTQAIVAASAVMSDSESGWATREWAAIPAAGSSFTIGYFVRETLKFLECV